MTVYLLPPNPGDDPTSLTAFTFAAVNKCPEECGPPSTYLEIIIDGAEERELPPEYRQVLIEIKKVHDS